MTMTKATTGATTGTTTEAAAEATFENTLPRYPLVEFMLMLASRFKAAQKPADQTGNAPILR
jgi:hypothetical protein